MLKLAVVLFVAGVVLEAATIEETAPIEKRAAVYDGGIDAGIRGEGDLKNKKGAYVGTDGNGYLKLVTSTSADTEWKFTSDNRWVHMADGKCVHPEGGSPNPADDTKLLLWDCEPYNADRIKFEGLTDVDYWNIKHLTSGKCVHPLQGQANAGVYLVLWGECGRNNNLDYIFVDTNQQSVPLE